MIRYIKGNSKYLNEVLDLFYRVNDHFLRKGVALYKGENLPEKSHFVEYLSKNDSTILALDDEKVIGFITSYNSDKFLNLFKGYEENSLLEKYHINDYKDRVIGYFLIFLDPEYRHQGITTKMVELMNKRFVGQYILFLVNKENRRFIKVASKVDFECLGEERIDDTDYYLFAKNQLSDF